jgi:CheY-like chemotaxis protein
MPERCVLVVDDDEGIRISLRFLLEMEGYQVNEAVTGEGALHAVATTTQPMVMLLDRMMPGGDGTSVLTALMQDTAWQARLAILFMTARSDPPDAALATLLANSTLATIVKPFDLDQVLAAVDTAWNSLTISAR